MSYTSMSDRPLVLVLTASMGAGHHQVGRELASRLSAYNVQTKTVDVSELLPAGWGRGLTGFYKFMACRAQGLYDLVFRLSMCPRQDGGATLLPLSIPAERRLSGLVAREKPALVLSNFHLCSQVAGRMRGEGRLNVPVVSMVLDFFVHGMWVHPGVDAHLLLHPVQAGKLVAQGGKNPHVCGPIVRPAFEQAALGRRRAHARRSLGLAPGDRCALIVAGSWGVGDVVGTLRTVLRAEGLVPIVVAGRNRRLRESLLACCGAEGRAIVFGWVNEMERLVAAADVVVENAGGLTAMEAMAAGVPVVTYAPIAGHGRANASEMARAGVSVYAHDPDELVAHVRAVTGDSSLRRALTSSARSMFAGDAAALLARWAYAGSTESAFPGASDRAVAVPSLL